jgi:hypothetical protein
MEATMSNKKDLDKELSQDCLAKGDDLNPEVFPHLGNLSAAFIYRFVCRPKVRTLPEFAYIQLDPHSHRDDVAGDDSRLAIEGMAAQWNMLWESGHLRGELLRSKLPKKLRWLSRFKNANLYLLPHTGENKYEIFQPLYQLIPWSTLSFHKLPPMRRPVWPPLMYDHLRQALLPKDVDRRLSVAFAHHIWPLLCSGSSIRSFRDREPLTLLAHNLNFWLPFVYKVAEDRLEKLGRCDFDDAKQRALYMKQKDKYPKSISLQRPLHGGVIWEGEQDAWQATKELVEMADRQGRLRGIIDAINSNRVQDDFSDRWSYAKEDFERRLYRKRAKIRVHFVELDNAVPVHAPTSELDENLLWEDFIALCDRKERRVVVCLKKGVTQVGEISKILGYANHSPVSKTLANIRRKAKRYFELS